MFLVFFKGFRQKRFQTIVFLVFFRRPRGQKLSNHSVCKVFWDPPGPPPVPRNPKSIGTIVFLWFFHTCQTKKCPNHRVFSVFQRSRDQKLPNHSVFKCFLDPPGTPPGTRNPGRPWGTRFRFRDLTFYALFRIQPRRKRPGSRGAPSLAGSVRGSPEIAKMIENAPNHGVSQVV